MRAFIFALALTLPIGLTACADSPSEEVAEAVEEQADERAAMIEERGDEMADAIEDGALYGGYDTDADGLLSEDEYNTGIGDGAFATYDLDQSGYLDENEYGAYESSLTM